MVFSGGVLDAIMVGMGRPLEVLSLGAGVQSTVLALMCEPDFAVFSDTGWEPDAVYEHLGRLVEAVDYPVYVVRNESTRSIGDIREDHLRAVRGDVERVSQMPLYSDAGVKGNSPLMRSCTSDYKIVPIERKLRELLGFKKGQRMPKRVLVRQWFGITTDEIQRMRINRHAWVENVYPLVDRRMSRHDCEKWLERNWGYPVPKSACVGCPYHNDRAWRVMRDHDPKSWGEAVAFDKALRGGEKLPGVKGNVYLHSSRVPLDEVDLRTPEDHGQMSFLDECEGMCGV